MDLTDTPEQTMLADSIGRFLTREHTDEARRRFLALPEGWSRDIWQTFAEMGLLAMAFEEDSGGLGGKETSLGVIAQALGRNLVGTPFYDTALLAGRLVELLGTPAQKERFIAPVLEGRQVLAFAHAEGAGNPVEYARPRTKALRSADGWVVCGAKTIVYNAPSADWIAVTAAIGDTDELGLFMVPAKAPGVSLSPLRTTDEHWAADVAFQDVAVPSDARLGGNARDALAAATDRATAIVCADAVGAMEALLAATTEYLQTRVQFGQPLARFQVLQHALARMAVHIAEARAITLLALLEARSAPQHRTLAVSAAKAKVAAAAQFVGRTTVQLHGGVGVTEDLAVSAYFRRLTAFGTRFGSISEHRDRYGEAMAGTSYSGRTLLRETAVAGTED